MGENTRGGGTTSPSAGFHGGSTHFMAVAWQGWSQQAVTSTVYVFTTVLFHFSQEIRIEHNLTATVNMFHDLLFKTSHLFSQLSGIVR